jgi:hypothetical protein
VELFPSRLAGESPAGPAAALREAFALVAELDKVVLFIDEVEEIAGSRQPRTVSAAQGVTNEMLKLIPPFREQEERLLICATNSVRALDSAFLRHGRFDSPPNWCPSSSRTSRITPGYERRWHTSTLPVRQSSKRVLSRTHGHLRPSSLLAAGPTQQTEQNETIPAAKVDFIMMPNVKCLARKPGGLVPSGTGPLAVVGAAGDHILLEVSE